VFSCCACPIAHDDWQQSHFIKIIHIGLNIADARMIDAGLVVFDLDGTLVDSSVDLANAVNALLLELGRSASC
jgi:hypothetical protein